MQRLLLGFLAFSHLAIAQTLTLSGSSNPLALTVEVDVANPAPAYSPVITITSSPSPVLIFISPVEIGGPTATGQWLQIAAVNSGNADCSSASYAAHGVSTTTPAHLCIEAVQTTPALLQGSYSGAVKVTVGSAEAVLDVALSAIPSGYLQLTINGLNFDHKSISFPLTAGQPQPPVHVNVIDNLNLPTSDSNDAMAVLDVAPYANDGTGAPWISFSLTDSSGAPTSTSPANLNISINQTLLPPGQTSVSGKLILSSKGSNQGTDYVIITAAAPSATALTVNPQSLSFTYQEGAITPHTSSFQVDTSPEGVPFSVQSSASWVIVGATSGTTGTSSAVIQVSVDPTQFPLSNPNAQIQVTAGSLTADATVSVNQIAASSGNYFVPMSPCRVVDTRTANGPFGGPLIGGGTSRSFELPAGSCGIPASATAYSLNLTVVPSVTLGYLTLWPTGQSQPVVSTLNSLDGRVKANAAIVPAGSNGAISAFATDDTDVILDVNGYFVPAGTPGAQTFYPLAPCRMVDTRNPAGPLGAPSLAPDSSRSFPILSSPCGAPPSAQAYSLNFTAVPSGILGYLTAWPSGQAQPLASSLNDPNGINVANAVIVPSGAGGAVSAFVTDQTDLLIDINGYFGTPGSGGLSFYPLQPCRILDTRNPPGTPPFSSTIAVNVSGSACSVPSTAQAYVLNATVVPPGFLGYITMWPQGSSQPVVSTLNATDGAITSNMAIVPTSNGSINVFASNSAYLILDISGYFAP